MNLVVITCAAYSDAWPGFFGLLEKFWPDHPLVHVLTDDTPAEGGCDARGDTIMTRVRGNASWCDVLRAYVNEATEPFLMMQEDFFLSAPVRADVIKRGERLLRDDRNGCVRVYPCPGPLDGRPGHIERGERYRISCQAALWTPHYLRQLLRAIPNARTAADFELMGTPASEFIEGAIMSWGRDDKPWPMEYICTAISRGKWNPDAKKLCDEHGIDVDWSRREFASA